jgi:hypothetical protein
MDLEAAGREAPAPEPRGDATRNRVVVAAFCVFLALLIPFFLYVGRHEWFQLDDWDYLARRRASDLGDLFRPHSGHWETIPLLVYRGLWSVFGLRYRVFELVSIVSTLAGAALLLVVMLRARTRPLIAVMAATLLVFFGEAQTNVAVRVTAITFLGFAVPLGLLQLLLADHDGSLDRRDWIGLACGLTALLCSSVAVAMLFVVGVAVTIRRGWRIALVHVGPPVAVFAVWYGTLGHKDPAPGSPTRLRPLPQTFHFTWVLVSVTFESITRTPGGVGLVLVALLVIGGVVAQRSGGEEFRRRAVVPFAMLVGAFAFAAETGFGRADLVEQGHRTMRIGHYMFVVALLALPAVALVIDELARRRRLVTVVAAALFLVVIPPNIHTFVSVENARGRREASFRNVVLLIPRLPVTKVVPREQVPLAGVATPVTVGWLLDGLRDGKLPKPHVTPVNTAIATLRVSLQLRPTGATGCRAFTTPVTRRLATGGAVRFRGRGIRVALSGSGPPTPATDYPTSTPSREWQIGNVGPPLTVTFSPVPGGAPLSQLCA